MDRPNIQGFAVKNEDGEILIRTVSDSKRAARVNWLVTEAMMTAIWDNWSDEKIKNTFEALAFKARATVVPIEVREAS